MARPLKMTGVFNTQAADSVEGWLSLAHAIIAWLHTNGPAELSTSTSVSWELWVQRRVIKNCATTKSTTCAKNGWFEVLLAKAHWQNWTGCQWSCWFDCKTSIPTIACSGWTSSLIQVSNQFSKGIMHSTSLSKYTPPFQCTTKYRQASVLSIMLNTSNMGTKRGAYSVTSCINPLSSTTRAFHPKWNNRCTKCNMPGACLIRSYR